MAARRRMTMKVQFTRGVCYEGTDYAKGDIVDVDVEWGREFISRKQAVPVEDKSRVRKK